MGNNQQVYDFYYSAKHEKLLKQQQRENGGQKYEPSFYRGKVYTEMMERGKTPVTSHFNDLVHLGTGTDSDISYGYGNITYKE